MTDPRARLAARQHEVLGALLRGDDLGGFDSHALQATTRVLHRKRWKAAAHLEPVLLSRSAQRTFHEFSAAVRRPPGCTHADLDAFARWLGERQERPPDLIDPALSRWARGRRARLAVEDGRRRVALVTERGRRVLLLGLGRSYYELPWGRAPR